MYFNIFEAQTKFMGFFFNVETRSRYPLGAHWGNPRAHVIACKPREPTIFQLLLEATIDFIIKLHQKYYHFYIIIQNHQYNYIKEKQGACRWRLSH